MVEHLSAYAVTHLCQCSFALFSIADFDICIINLAHLTKECIELAIGDTCNVGMVGLTLEKVYLIL